MSDNTSDLMSDLMSDNTSDIMSGIMSDIMSDLMSVWNYPEITFTLYSKGYHSFAVIVITLSVFF